MDYINPLGGRNHISAAKVDQLYEKATSIVLKENNASMSLLQKRLNISFDNAKSLIDRMERDGIIGPFDGKTPRKVFGRNGTAGGRFSSPVNVGRIVQEEEKWRRTKSGLTPIECELAKVDGIFRR